MARILQEKIWNTWDILEIIGISDQRQRRFRRDFRLNNTRVVALLAGRPEEAQEHYRSALRVDPKDVAARQSLAMIAESVDHDPAAALRLCEEVKQIAPETPGNDDCLRRNRAALSGTGPPR